jgi:alpha/beta superfamily hydrolase
MTVDPAAFSYATPDRPELIRAATVLPARRENIEFTTADGLRLVGELALPEGEIRGTLITLHPLPTHGGFMDSHVYRKASYRLPALAGLAVLRFNTRGTSSPRGTSEGTFDEGIGEQADLAAAVDFAVRRGLPNRWLIGWSFGTELVLKYGVLPPVADEVQGAVLLSPPLHRAANHDLDAWAASGKPLRVLVPELDDYLRPAEAQERFARIPQADVVGIMGCKHLWVGEKFASRALQEIAVTVLGDPELVLPPQWAGPVAMAPA